MKYDGLARIESSAIAPDDPAAAPFVELRLWVFKELKAPPVPLTPIRMTQEAAAVLIGHLQQAIAAPGLAQTTKSPGSRH